MKNLKINIQNLFGSIKKNDFVLEEDVNTEVETPELKTIQNDEERKKSFELQQELLKYGYITQDMEAEGFEASFDDLDEFLSVMGVKRKK